MVRLMLLAASTSVVLVVSLSLNLRGTWTPPPEAIRFGPMTYDSELSRPLNSSIVTPYITPTDLRLRFRFAEYSRPISHSYLFSTATGLGRGLKIAIDKYGNVFLSIGRPSFAADDYQLVKVSDPTELGSENLLEVRVDLTVPTITIAFNGLPVAVSEARPNQYFNPREMALEVTNIEIGGSESWNFDGQMSNVEVVMGEASRGLEQTTILLLLMIFLVGIALWFAGRLSTGLFSL